MPDVWIKPEPVAQRLGLGRTLVALPGLTPEGQEEWHLYVGNKRLKGPGGFPASWKHADWALSFFWEGSGHGEYYGEQHELQAAARARLDTPGALSNRQQWLEDYVAGYMSDETRYFDENAPDPTPHEYADPLTGLNEALHGIIEALFADLIDGSDTLHEAKVALRRAIQRLLENGETPAAVQYLCDIWQRAMRSPKIELVWQGSPQGKVVADPELEDLLSKLM